MVDHLIECPNFQSNHSTSLSTPCNFPAYKAPAEWSQAFCTERILPCLLGEYQDEMGQSACKRCDIGKYQERSAAPSTRSSRRQSQETSPNGCWDPVGRGFWRADSE